LQTLTTTSVITYQIFIWVPIFLTLALLGALCMMQGIEVDKNRDTILYAKFVQNVKDK